MGQWGSWKLKLKLKLTLSGRRSATADQLGQWLEYI
jgi:hypothetical protein